LALSVFLWYSFSFMARNKKGQSPRKKVGYAPPRRFSLDLQDKNMLKLIETLPKGLFAILANENARFTQFHAATAQLVMPYGSRISFHTGCYVVDSSNRAIGGLKKGEEDWICLMGDDHSFPPHMVIKLLTLMYKNDLDIIVPLCFKRSFPPAPVIYDLNPETGYPRHIDLSKYPEGGLIEIDYAGSAGMIIRDRVIAKMYEEGDIPIFQLGGEQWGEDLDFCRRAKKHGFRVWCDLDMPLGHIVNTTLWPTLSDGEWGCQYEFNQQGGFFLGL
jgi:hypothetical protein